MSDETCTHPSCTGFHAQDGTSTLTCSSCGEVLVLDTGLDTFEVEVTGSRTKTDVLMFRSWTGRRWLNGEPYDGPVYLWLTTREYRKELV